MSLKLARDPEHTKQEILEATYIEVHKNGFQAASLSTILAHTKLTKGALYHHYPNKTALGYALIEYVVSGYINSHWIEPMVANENPIDGIQDILQNLDVMMTQEKLSMGCPLNNLTQEMSSIDEGFRKRLEAIYEHWADSISKALKKGQKIGYVRKSLNTAKVAVFIVASIQGSIGMAKNSQRIEPLQDCGDLIIGYLETLRAVSSRKSGCVSGSVHARWHGRRPKSQKHLAVA